MIFEKKRHIYIEKVGTAYVAFDLTNHLPVALNTVAGFVLLQTDGRTDTQAVASRVSRRYSVPFQRAFEDINALYANLAGRRIVKRVR